MKSIEQRLADEVTRDRKDAARYRDVKRERDRYHAALVKICEGGRNPIAEAALETAPDRYCITTPDGGCIGGTLAGQEPCMHDAARAFGRRGGKVTSPAKRRTARENGKKGGRPPRG